MADWRSAIINDAVVKTLGLTAQSVTVPYSPTPVFDASLGNSFQITLTGDVTSSTFINVPGNSLIIFKIVQDATGGHNFVWPTNVFGGMSFTSGFAAGVVVTQLFYFDGTNAYSLGPGSAN